MTGHGKPSTRSIEAIAVWTFMWIAVGSTVFADVQISMSDGQVSIVAKDATVGQILAEWARIGRTTIVNLDRISGDPVTIELTNVSEQQALDVVLRKASGYIASPRDIRVANASRFDRILVMPPSVAPAAPASGTRAATNARGPAAYQTPAYLSQQAAIAEPAPADESADVSAGDTTAADASPIGVNADQPVSMEGAVAPPDASAQVVNKHRRALETMDPRDFKVPIPPPGGVAILPPRRGAPRGGDVAPGMIVQPATPRRPPGAQDQSPVDRG